MRNPSSKTTSELGNKKKNIKGKSNSSSVNVTKMSSSNNNNNNNKTTPCCSKVGLKRGPWTAEEDEMLSNYIHKAGEGRWRTLPKRAGLLRCGKSCRLRWMNYLRPSVKRGHIAPDEEDLILRLHRLLGNRWSLIAGRIPGRTDNEIKNYWNTHLSKKLISQGIDPRTHKPLNPDHEYHSVQIINNLNKVADQAQTNPNIINNRKETEKEEEEEAEDHNNNGCLNVQGGIAHFNDDHQLGEYDESQLVQYHDPYNVAAVSNRIIEEEEQEDVNYCSDQVLSSFLNSFINEDAFDAHHDPHHHSNYNNNYMMMSNIGNNNNNIVPQHHLHIHDHLPPVSDALDTTNWESAFMSSPFNQSDPNKS